MSCSTIHDPPGEQGNLGFSSWPYLNLVNGFLIFFLPGFEEGLGIFNHLLQTVFWLLEWKGKVGEAEGRDGWDRTSHRARPGKERERERMRLKEAGETEDEDWGQGLRTRGKQVTDGGHRGKTELEGASGWEDGPGAWGGGAGSQGREVGYLSRGLCSGQGIAREILPEQQGLLRLLPSQAVTVVLKIILPPRDREPGRQGCRRGGGCGGSGLGQARGGRADSQLVQHALHLLVDAEGRALLLVPVGAARPVTLRQGGVLLRGLALPLPPPHGRDLNGRQVQRLQRRGRVREEKGGGRRPGAREARTSGKGGRTERRHSYDTEQKHQHHRDRQTDAGGAGAADEEETEGRENGAVRSGNGWPGPE